MKKMAIKRKMLYSLLIPYILLGVVGTMFFGYMYITSVRNIHNEAIQSNHSILSKITREIDYLISDLERLVLEVESNYKFKRILDVEKGNRSGIDNYEIAMALQELKSIKKYNHLIEDIIIYYQKGDFFINSQSIRNEHGIYQDYEDSIVVSYEEWKGTLTSRYDEGQLARTGDFIYYATTIPFNENEETANIIIKLNTYNLEELINGYSTLNEGNLYVVDKQYKNILKNNNKDIVVSDQEEEDLQELIQDQQSYSGEINIDHKKYMILYARGQNLELQYIWLVESSKLNQKSNYILIAFSSMGIVFAILFILGIYGVKDNYQKIIQIIERLSKSNLPVTEKIESEVSYIHSVLNTMEQRIEEQEKVMTENTIRKALYGLIEDKDEEYTELLTTHKALCEGQSIVALFEDIKCSDKEAKEIKLNLFIIENIIKELFGDKIISWIVQINNWHVIIINWPTGEEYELEYILDSLERVRKFLLDQLELSYTIGISSPSEGISQLAVAYKEAIQALEEKQVIGNSRIIYYGDIVEHHNQYKYDETMSKQLVNYIKLGNYEKAKEFIDEVYTINFEENHISVEYGKLLILELIETMEEVARELKCSISIEPTEVLKEIYTAYDIKNKINEAISKLCEQGVQSRENTESRESKILKYIQENYNDSNLNVAMIADQFELNPSYLSRFFKEQTGENLLSYINNYRVERAKELLVNTDKTLVNISLEIGFVNAAALTRAFKKYEGITPGQYKVIHKKENV